MDYNHQLFYKYYVCNSKDYKLLNFLYDEENSDERWAMEHLMKVVLLFDSEEEHCAFEEYVLGNLTLLQEQLRSSKTFSHIDTGKQQRDIKSGYVWVKF